MAKEGVVAITEISFSSPSGSWLAWRLGPALFIVAFCAHIGWNLCSCDYKYIWREEEAKQGMMMFGMAAKTQALLLLLS